MTKARASLMALCMSLAACSAAPPPAAAEQCPLNTETIVGEYRFGGSLGVQSGPIVALRANQPPVKAMFANRAPTPPREMTIQVRTLDGAHDAVSTRAGWAPTRIDQTFPTSSPVLGYVSEIPTLPVAGCWELRWSEGTAADRIVVRVLP